MENQEALFEAVRSGDCARIREILDAEPGLIDAHNSLGQGAVLLARYHRQDEALAILLERAPTLNLWEAAAVGDNDRLLELLDGDGAALDAHSPDGFTPLGLAAFFGQETIVHNLLARGADPNVAANNTMQVAPLHSAVAGQHLRIVRMLVEADAQVNVAQQKGFTPLHGAAHSGNVELVQYLLSHGAEVSARTAGGQTALDLALTQAHRKVVGLLEAARPKTPEI
jgi:ankyrin repeat protein